MCIQVDAIPCHADRACDQRDFYFSDHRPQSCTNISPSFLLAAIVCFFIGNTVSQFSRYIPSSGGYYSFATRGLRSRSGVMATWSYLACEMLGTAGYTDFLGYLVSEMLQTQFHAHISWWWIALATTAVI